MPDGSGYHRFLSQPDADRPLAVDLTSQYLYWSEAGGRGRTQRSDTDGSNIVNIIPNVLVYDFQVTENFIYFSDNNFPDGACRIPGEKTSSVDNRPVCLMHIIWTDLLRKHFLVQ
jgi:hypothetical protein